MRASLTGCLFDKKLDLSPSNTPYHISGHFQMDSTAKTQGNA